MRIKITKLPNKMALGGVLQTHGGDFSDGLTIIGAGDSHEENPNQGVQMGVDPEGTPNLVEEGEAIFNDYVYSKRIKLDSEAKEKMHFPKKRDITYAEAAKSLEKESKERPNDPISQAALKAQMEDLAEEQERQKQEMEAKRAREAFEALSPEEQTAVMQQVAQQEQMTQQQAMQEQAMAAQAPEMQQPAVSPEMAAVEQQPAVGGVQAGVPMGAPMMAEGGKLYYPGGDLNDIYDAENDPFTVEDFNNAIAGQEEAIAANNAAVEKAFDKKVLRNVPKNLRKKMSIIQFLSSLGYKTVKDAEKAGWRPSDFGKYSNWNDINNTTMLPDDFEWSYDYDNRISDPAMRAAMSLGYNPLMGTLQRQWYEGDNGNDVGWTQSVGKDKLTAEEFNNYAKRYKNTLGWAVEQGLIKAPKEGETISTKDIVKAMQQAPDWQATDRWLYSDLANQAKYLGMARGMNPSDDTKFVNRWSPYGTFTQGEDGNWTYNLKDNLTDAEKQAFTDQFKKTRNDGWLGVMYNNFHDPGLTTNRYVLDEKGNPTLLLSDDLSDYEQVGGPFTWGDEDADMNNRAIFYRAKGSTEAGGNASGDSDGKVNDADNWSVEPIHRNDKLRYAGLFGPAIGLGMQLAGIGRPDTSGLDAAVSMSRGAGHLADYQPIGDYMRYQPLDRLFYANQLQANARATDRNLMNTSGGNRGTAMAGLLANAYNTNNNLGNLWRQAEEYNLAQREKVAAFNKDTNKFNAEAYNRNSQFNADALNRQGQYSAQLAMQAAREKMDADAAWNQGIYGNVAGLFKGIGDLGRENAQHNMIADMAATGIFGTIKNQPIGNGYIRVVPRNEAAKGGKINKKKGKRGLTY